MLSDNFNKPSKNKNIVCKNDNYKLILVKLLNIF